MTMKKNVYWLLSRDKETTELKFSKLFHRRFEARQILPISETRASQGKT
jgi:hypothetical protein